MQLCSETYNWPGDMASFLKRSEDLQNARTNHLKAVVEGKNDALGKRRQRLEKMIEALAEREFPRAGEHSHGQEGECVSAVWRRRPRSAKHLGHGGVLEGGHGLAQEEVLEMVVGGFFSI